MSSIVRAGGWIVLIISIITFVIQLFAGLRLLTWGYSSFGPTVPEPGWLTLLSAFVSLGTGIFFWAVALLLAQTSEQMEHNTSLLQEIRTDLHRSATTVATPAAKPSHSLLGRAISTWAEQLDAGTWRCKYCKGIVDASQKNDVVCPECRRQ